MANEKVTCEQPDHKSKWYPQAPVRLLVRLSAWLYGLLFDTYQFEPNLYAS